MRRKSRWKTMNIKNDEHEEISEENGSREEGRGEGENREEKKSENVFEVSKFMKT